MKKDLAIIAGLFLLVIALLVFGQGYSSMSFLQQNQQGTPSAGALKGTVNVTVKTLNIDAEVAATSNQRKKGLSKREEMPFNQGMLFVFENPGQFGIWMKDMKFALDIIWLDTDKKIVDLVANVPPETGKKDKDLTIYKPSTDAKYILEINAGLVQLHDLQIGDQVTF